MEPQKISLKNLFINLGAIVALYVTVVSLLQLLFTIINNAYPQITNGYNYFGSQSISWPVATIIVSFPIFIFLMWLLEKEYMLFPERQSSGIHKFLSYATLFLSGLAISIDLITLIYYFLDGQELTTGFVLKVLVLLVVASAIFAYYLSDVLGKLTAKSRNFYRVLALAIVVASIAWGFAVLGSPHTQRLYKYDEQKVSDLQNINNQVMNFYATKGVVPASLAELGTPDYYFEVLDSQTKKPYVYEKTGTVTYNLCAEFNKASNERKNIGAMYSVYPYGEISWTHPEGHHCFEQTINPNMYSKPVPMR